MRSQQPRSHLASPTVTKRAPCNPSRLVVVAEPLHCRTQKHAKVKAPSLGGNLSKTRHPPKGKAAKLLEHPPKILQRGLQFSGGLDHRGLRWQNAENVQMLPDMQS